MLDELFQNLRGYINHFFESVDLVQVEQVMRKLLESDGTVFLTGVGKSGHIAQKIAATLASTGTKSVFLSPSHALHGDMGVVSPKDICLLFSKSGASDELFELMQHLRHKGVYLIAIVSQMDSLLAKIADQCVYLPIQRELCPYDLAPTTSTVVQLIFGDCLAMALMRAKGFSISEFASNHPAGLLGRKMTLKVSDLMLTGDAIPKCSSQHCLIDVLHELTAKRCGCLLIEDQGRLEGIFTDGDLRRVIESMGPKALDISLAKLVNPSPRTITSDVLALDALHQMEANVNALISVLPVVEQGLIVGLIRMHDILQAGLRASVKSLNGQLRASPTP